MVRLCATDTASRNIYLRGYFQRVEYYLHHRAAITRWLAIRTSRDAIMINKNDVLVNIRQLCADYGMLKHWAIAI